MVKRILILIICLLPLSANAARKMSIEAIGDVLTMALPAYAIGMTSMEHDYQGTVQFAESYAATIITTETLRGMVKDPRPNGRDGGYISGHASSAFSAATFIWKRYGIKQAAIPLALAGFTAFSRVESGWHSEDNVVMGALIATGFTWLFTDKYNISVGSDGHGASLNFKTMF